MIFNWVPAGKIAIQIGIKIPKVPHEVPVANARQHAITKIIAGRKSWKPEAELPTTPFTNSFAPRLSVIPFKVHARERIKIAGTIALKPSGIQTIASVKETSRRKTK